MAESRLPTQVDVFQLQNAVKWLQDTKTFIDESIVAELRKIPGIVGNAPTNPDDQTAALATQSGGALPTPTTGSVVGVLTTVGPTYFGTLPNGVDVAQRHASAYNTVLIGLDTLSKDLGKAIAATTYILTNYANVEEATAADISRFMENPPYQPGPESGDDAQAPPLPAAAQGRTTHDFLGRCH